MLARDRNALDTRYQLTSQLFNSSQEAITAAKLLEKKCLPARVTLHQARGPAMLRKEAGELESPHLAAQRRSHT